MEKGYSISHDGGSDVRWPRVTYGLVFQNTSGVVAHYAHVKIRMLDASGRALKPATTGKGTASGTSIERTIEYLLPGERVGIGGAGYMDPYEDANRVAKLEVTIGKAEWWPRKNDTWCFPSANATQAALVRRDKDGGTMEFELDLEKNPFDDFLVGEVIFRDRRGRIVGGGYVDDVTTTPEGGQAQIVWGIPLQFDASKTEFHVRVGQPPMTVCRPG